MVSHHDLCCTVINHGLNELENLTLSGASIDQITDEDRLAGGVTEGARPPV
jgi:hypothetical protein